MRASILAPGSLLALSLVAAGCGGGDGLIHRETLQGNNSAGPYFLTYTPIADGSELVKVDGRPQQLGEDYTIDYSTGQLWFAPPGKQPLVVPATSTISVTYQSAGRGYRGSRNTARFQVDLFYGSGATGPFDVRYSPILTDGTAAVVNGRRHVIRHALMVLVDDQEQREGVDFDTDRQIGRITFRRIVPASATVRVRYYYAVAPAALAPRPPSGTWPHGVE